MSKFDYDKIKDMEYDPDRGRFVGKDGSEFKSTPYSDGSGYKYDYYDSSTYGNAPHNSTHVKSDLNENWDRTDNDRDNGTQTHSSGNGCYLTTACMMHMQENFDDNCDELSTLRWFRDRFVSASDIEQYYEISPLIVKRINENSNKASIYSEIYKEVIVPCVNAIKSGNYEFAYTTYKNSVLKLKTLYFN
ncbi:MAG: hypothetical protein IJ395_03470 [Clostridia bacterium]|nr:hypothetical protein [Clostridia bacterium]